jgi:hypothetical protein
MFMQKKFSFFPKCVWFNLEKVLFLFLYLPGISVYSNRKLHPVKNPFSVTSFAGFFCIFLQKIAFCEKTLYLLLHLPGFSVYSNRKLRCCGGLARELSKQIFAFIFFVGA